MEEKQRLEQKENCKNVIEGILSEEHFKYITISPQKD